MGRAPSLPQKWLGHFGAGHSDNLHGSARRKKFFSRISVPRGEDSVLFKEGMNSCLLFSSIRWWNFKNLRLTKSWAEKNWEAVKKPLCSNFIQLGQIYQLGQPFPWPSHLFLFPKLFPQILYRRNSLLNSCLLFIPKHQLKEKQESRKGHMQRYTQANSWKQTVYTMSISFYPRMKRPWLFSNPITKRISAEGKNPINSANSIS